MDMILSYLILLGLASLFPYANGLVLKRCTPNTAGWAPTAASWKAAGTDAWIQSWWANQTNKTETGFSSLMGQQFLPTDPSWECGINSVCEVQDCQRELESMKPPKALKLLISELIVRLL
jgi:hypothetical protein